MWCLTRGQAGAEALRAISFQVMPVVMVAGLPVTQARDPGLQPFCVTVDQQAGEYLPHLSGSGGYVVIHCPSQLPRELPLLYARLTAS